MKHDIALIGLGVMGQNLARNLAGRKIRTLVFNRHTEKAEQFITAHGGPFLDCRKTLKALVADLKTPRKIILMVKSGAAVDELIGQIAPLLSRGDMLIDAGNSLYKDSERRAATLAEKGLRFVGMGVSGGEEGALRGPSLMPGGDAAAIRALLPMLRKIAAKDFQGKPCVTAVGAGGAGHYVKMVHNGIEYAVMQMMAEAYQMLRDSYKLPADKIAGIFQTYNRGPLRSFLFEIASPVFSRTDDLKKGYLVDSILDAAGQKGTGRWTAIDALEIGAVLPSVTEAVYARAVSSFKQERTALGKYYKKPRVKPPVLLAAFTKMLENALTAGLLSVYAQGFEQLRAGAEANGWKIDRAELARVWQGGCIIRAELLRGVRAALLAAKGRPLHLFGAKEVQKVLQKNLSDWRRVVSVGALSGIPLPAFGSSLSYFESMTTAFLPANFIQGLRDTFGAHGYERADRKGFFHTDWSL